MFLPMFHRNSHVARQPRSQEVRGEHIENDETSFLEQILPGEECPAFW